MLASAVVVFLLYHHIWGSVELQRTLALKPRSLGTQAPASRSRRERLNEDAAGGLRLRGGRQQVRQEDWLHACAAWAFAWEAGSRRASPWV